MFVSRTARHNSCDLKRQLAQTCLFFVTLALVLTLGSGELLAVTTIRPGETKSFTEADGGSRDVEDVDEVCDGNARFDPSKKEVHAGASCPGQLLLESAETHALIWNDFEVPDDAGTGASLDGQVSYNVAWQGFFYALGVQANAAVSVTLSLRDLGTKQETIPLDTSTLTTTTEVIHENGVGTEYCTDPSSCIGVNFNDANSRADSFPIQLIRGHTYRLEFQLTCEVDALLGLPTVCDFSSLGLGASWTQLEITVGADLVELLGNINAEVMENTLQRCEKILSLRLPAAVGGRAEEVRDLVEMRIMQSQEAGLDTRAISRAQIRFDKGVGELRARQYGAAYGDFCMAYRILADSP